MWEYEHSVETAASAGTVWRHWSDMAAWPRWNDGIESIEVGPQLGPAITADFPDVLAALVRLAEEG
ncbi:hypothetical protein ACQP2K_40075 [Microbispora siamensis]